MADNKVLDLNDRASAVAELRLSSPENLDLQDGAERIAELRLSQSVAPSGGLMMMGIG